MKHLLFVLLMLLLGGTFTTGCDPNSDSLNGPAHEPMAARARSDAHPAWVFEGTSTSHGKTYPSISVSDVDGSDLSPIYLASVTSNRELFATWSPNGTSVSFVDMPGLIANGWYTGTVWGDYALKAIDVTVTNGQVSASNLRTIFSVTSSDQMKIVSQAWCPATSGSGAGKIAFMLYTSTESRIYLISTSGGTPTLIYSTTNTDARLQGNSLTWSSDGTKLAFAQFSGTLAADADVVSAIKIIDLSGNVLTTLLDGYKRITELQWSNSGLDRISFEGSATSTDIADLNKYIVEPVTNATPTLLVANDGGGYGMYWSPDNTKMVFRSINANSYIYDLSSGTSTLVGRVNSGDWK